MHIYIYCNIDIYYIICVIINIATIIVVTITTIIAIIIFFHVKSNICIYMIINMIDKNIHFITIFEATITSRSKYKFQDMYANYTATYEEITRQWNVCMRYLQG